MNLFSNLLRACLAIAAAPVAAVADVLALPGTAYDGKPAFGRTGALLGAAGEAFTTAIKPEKTQ